MTDEQIINALECCIDCNCKECPACRIIDGGTYCTEIDEEEILDLINRQKAEIDILIRKKETLRDEIAELQLKNSELENEKVLNSVNFFASVKTETIKEFAERLKEMKHNKQILRLPLLDLDIDNLVKEMVGDDNG